MAEKKAVKSSAPKTQVGKTTIEAKKPEKRTAKSPAPKAETKETKAAAKTPERKVAKSPAPKAQVVKAKPIAKTPARKEPVRHDVADRTSRSKPVEVKKAKPPMSSTVPSSKPGKTLAAPAPKARPKAYTLDEVRSFINQHREGKGIKLPGRTAEDIGTIHDAYNQSTYKYAESVLELLKKWANN
ncbi:MAG: hypothetical protein ACLQVM_25345 [Terriglobia bacterium]